MSGRSFDPDYAAQIGRRLRECRNGRGWSLARTEELSGVNAVTLASWERGDRGVPVHKLAALAALYGIPVANLIPGATDAPPARSGAGEYPAEVSLSRDDLGRWVLAASGPHMTLAAVAVDQADAEAAAELYVALKRARDGVAA